MQQARKHQNPAYEQSKQPIQSRYKKFIWIFLSVLAILFVIATAVQQFIPIEEPPIQENTWQGLTPGFKLTPKLLETLGAPVKVESLPAEKQKVSYTSEHFAAYYNEVIVTKDGIVEFIAVPTKYEETHTVSNYITLYGQPDIELYASHISTNSKAHVFLNEGIAVISKSTSSIVTEIWYFQPTDRETFLNTWGEELTPESSYPEAFPGL